MDGLRDGRGHVGRCDRRHRRQRGRGVAGRRSRRSRRRGRGIPRRRPRARLRRPLRRAAPAGEPGRVDPPRRAAVGRHRHDRECGRRTRAPWAPRLDARRMGDARGLRVAGALPLAARARLRLPRRTACVAALAPRGDGGVRRVGRDRHPALPRPEARRTVRQGRQSAALRRLGERAAAAVLDLLGRAAGVAVPRRGLVARALSRGRRAAAPPGPVARLWRAPGPVVARRRLAAVPARRVDRSDRRHRPHGLPGLARDRRRRRGDPPRPLRDRPAAQPHAGLRRAHRAAGRHVRGRRAPGRPGGRRLGVVGVAGDARRRARVPAPARPRPERGRPSLRAGALRGGAAAARLHRRGARGSRRPATPSAGASSATCTTAPSSGW
jgi:hypothetical protein